MALLAKGRIFERSLRLCSQTFAQLQWNGRPSVDNARQTTELSVDAAQAGRLPYDIGKKRPKAILDRQTLVSDEWDGIREYEYPDCLQSHIRHVQLDHEKLQLLRYRWWSHQQVLKTETRRNISNMIIWYHFRTQSLKFLEIWFVSAIFLHRTLLVATDSDPRYSIILGFKSKGRGRIRRRPFAALSSCFYFQGCLKIIRR